MTRCCIGPDECDGGAGVHGHGGKPGGMEDGAVQLLHWVVIVKRGPFRCMVVANCALQNECMSEPLENMVVPISRARQQPQRCIGELSIKRRLRQDTAALRFLIPISSCVSRQVTTIISTSFRHLHPSPAPNSCGTVLRQIAVKASEDSPYLLAPLCDHGSNNCLTTPNYLFRTLEVPQTRLGDQRSQHGRHATRSITVGSKTGWKICTS
ncbi:hypothetical protein MRB53_040726 [Persea americana]|nr:hypothetical protein MRB53_040726 [Persea americana]